MRIELPELCLVLLLGASGSGKSTFAARHFKPTEVLSSDFFRGIVSDDETNQGANAAAFDSLYFVAAKRLEGGKLTVIDATNVLKKDREKALRLAREQNCLTAAIVLDMDQTLCLERNQARRDRQVGRHIILNQLRDLRSGLRSLKREGFRYVFTLKGPEEADSAEIHRTRLWNDRRDERGPFDLIGDIHGCYEELCSLLEKMGYQVNREEARAVPPLGRKTVFLGDYCDRGPRNLDALRLVMHMAAEGALCLPGNHEMKLLKKLRGSQVNLTYGLERTTAEFEGADPAFIEEVKGFLDGLVSHYVLDGGNLVAAHAGLKEKLQGRSSGIVRNFCLYGETTGETDEYGLPVRLDWAEEYRGKALVVYGHTPVPEALVYNNTVCIDTGCVFGGKLSAYRYPEGEIVQVPAQAQYYAPAKPLAMGGVDGNSGLALSIGDILGTRRIATRLIPEILIEERSSAVALETISRFAADPRWLIYLPPTMSPCETSGLAEYLEYPAESFEYYRKRGIFNLICEEKHMGSRAVIILCRNEETARERFGVSGGTGIIYTRTGRHFFDEEAIETALLDRLRSVLDRSRFWEDFSTPWLCLDTELLPWSAKARSLILEQYAPTGRAGRSGLTRVLAALAVREDRSKRDALSAGEARVGAVGTCAPAAPAQAGIVSGGDFDPEALGEAYHCRLECLEAYTAAYRRYCRPVNSVADYRIAPFHILATEGTVWNEETHLRHLEVIRNYMCGEDPIFIPTRYRLVDIGDEASLLEAADWWRELTGSGGEGMVVKPLDFIAWGSEREGMGEQGSRRRLAQPALKCRGREYLRIIYGPEYTAPAYMERLRKRSLSRKRHLALSEFGLGMEALERFVRREPFRRVHECVFGILALESEPVDPRL